MGGCVAAGSGSPRSGPPGFSRALDEQPNVLIFVTDDQRRRGTLKVLPKTMETFREGGTEYVNGVVTTPLCCPSRASIFSGKYAHNHGVKNNNGAPLLDESETIQAQLHAHGYRTALVGKYLNYAVESPSYFDRWAMMIDPPHYYDGEFNLDGRRATVSTYSTDFLEHKALEFLDDFERSDDRAPWFMQVATWAPHIRPVPEPEYATAPVDRWRRDPANSERDRSDKPRWVRSVELERAKAAEVRRGQLRTLMSVDDLVAQVFERLRDMGEARNTLAFFLSDNGWSWYEHGLNRKRFPYDDSVRVPFFVRWPGRITAGAVERKVVANIDIAPTVYEAAGIEASYEVDGKSLFSSDRSSILIEYFPDPDVPFVPAWRQLWSPRRSYIRYPGTGTREFYGPDDPWQIANVYRDGIPGNRPRNESRMDRRLARAARCAGAGCP